MKHQNHSRPRLQAGFSLIELLIVVAIIGILAAIALPRLQESLKLGRETATIQSLKTINQNQAHYFSLKSKFGTLQDLNQAQLIDANYANGSAVSGYTYTSPEADADKYCVQATRQAATTSYKDFNVIEDGTIRFVESKAPSPVPHDGGTPMSGAGAGAGPGDKGAAQPAK